MSISVQQGSILILILKALGGEGKCELEGRILNLYEGDSAKNIETDFEKWKNDFWTKLGKLFHNNMENSPTRSQDKKNKPQIKVLLIDQTDPSLEETKEATPQLRIAQNLQQELLKTKAKIETTYDLSSRQYFNGHDLQVENMTQLRKNEDFGSTLLLRLKSPVQYQTADDLALFPQNSHLTVSSIAQRLDVETKLDFKIYFQLQGITIPKRLKLPFHGGVTLRDALTRFFDVTGPLNPRLLNELAELAQDQEQKKKLAELAILGLKKDATISHDNAFHQLSEKRFGLLTILTQFKSIDLTLDKFFGLVPRIMPRYYTIASSSLALPGSIQIAISLTKIKLQTGEVWQGLASHFLNSIFKTECTGKTIRGFIKKSDFRLPKEIYGGEEMTKIPNVIMIGPGTGVAPFRGFLQEIDHLEKKNSFTYQLYFGCKRRDSDFIFEEELREHFKDSEEDLVVAFSREEEQKRYVQHILAERADQVKKHIFERKGYMYLCGSYQMGKETQDLIQKIIEDVIPEKQEAQAFWKDLQKSGRFVKELWG